MEEEQPEQAQAANIVPAAQSLQPVERARTLNMIDFEQISRYRENNRIEAKKALGGLPKSLWETYSAFANTYGGIILLGVIELTDKSFQTVDLPAPEKLLKEFWEIIEDKEKVNVNILAKKDAAVHEVNGNRIIAITVPRAGRRSKPVYIGQDPYHGTYRRDGEGDYHCSEEEVRMMLRDREERTQDMRLLTGFRMDAFDYETVRRYRTYLKDFYPEYKWDQYEDAAVLQRIGACGTDKRKDVEGALHPTAAGLLMFGFEDEIVKEFPYYYLDYQEMRWDGSIEDRIVSNSGKWSGNLFDFYLRICGKLIRGLPNDIHKPVREAVANCMMNGDYFGVSGLVIVKKKEEICITNPGSFRIDVEEAVSGGRSDPRNAVLARLFRLVRVGAHAGKGVPDIYRAWESRGFQMPQIKERFKPDRITLTLPLYPDRTGNEMAENIPELSLNKNEVMDYITRIVSVKSKDIAELLGTGSIQAERMLKQMAEEGILVYLESGEEYQLKI